MILINESPSPPRCAESPCAPTEVDSASELEAEIELEADIGSRAPAHGPEIENAIEDTLVDDVAGTLVLNCPDTIFADSVWIWGLNMELQQAEAVEKIDITPCIWQHRLTTLDGCLQASCNHVDRVLDGVVERGRLQTFYFGITQGPTHRWSN